MAVFLGYMASLSLLAGLGLTACYLYDPEKVQGVAIRLVWNMGTYYYQVYDYFRPPLCDIVTKKGPDQGYEEDEASGDEEIEELKRKIAAMEEEDDMLSARRGSQTIVYYVAADKSTYCTANLDEEAMEIVEEANPSIIFLKTKYENIEYFVRTESPLEENTEHTTLEERPFVQVEFIEGGRAAVDIHTKLAPFYVAENRILDRPFLEWYLSYYYDIHSFGEYVLKIFDKDVNMLTLKEGQAILLSDGGYEILDAAKEGKGTESDIEN